MPSGIRGRLAAEGVAAGAGTLADTDLINLVLLPLGLGLLGFVEPCSIGSSLVFIRYLEGKAAAAKVLQVVVFTLTRAAFIGGLGAVAALVGGAFIDFQRAGWILLGSLYVVLGAVYLLGQAGVLMRTLGPGLGRLSGAHGAIGLGVLFGLNIPACAAPLLAAVLGSAAIAGVGGALQGFVALALFGLALSLPLVLAVLWRPARRALDRLSALSARIPVWIGLLLIVLGLWSISFGLFVSPVQRPTVE